VDSQCQNVNQKGQRLVKTFITMHHPYSFTGQYQYIAATINLKGKENES